MTDARTLSRLLMSMVIVGTMLLAVLYTLPSNVLIARSEGAGRTAFNTLMPEAWGYFTRDPRGDQIIAYQWNGHEAVSLMTTPQNRPSNLLGLSRTQRAQGPEISNIAQQVEDWVECDDYIETCLQRTRGVPVHKVTNSSPVPTICRDVLMTFEQTTPWAYRNSSASTRRVKKFALMSVACSS